MAQLIAIRSLNRSANVRVLDSAGDWVKLSTTMDTVVDLDIADNLRELSRHGAIGQWIVTATGQTYSGGTF